MICTICCVLVLSCAYSLGNLYLWCLWGQQFLALDGWTYISLFSHQVVCTVGVAQVIHPFDSYVSMKPLSACCMTSMSLPLCLEAKRKGALRPLFPNGVCKSPHLQTLCAMLSMDCTRGIVTDGSHCVIHIVTGPCCYIIAGILQSLLSGLRKLAGTSDPGLSIGPSYFRSHTLGTKHQKKKITFLARP